MNLLGAMIFWGFGTVFLLFSLKLLRKKHIDYAPYPITTATVLHTENYAGERWIVSFHLHGKEVWGMDDRFAGSTFHPEKYHLPKQGTQEKIYYWKYTGNSSYGKVEYYFHFYDESLYELRNLKEKSASVRYGIFGLIFLLSGLLLLLFR